MSTNSSRARYASRKLNGGGLFVFKIPFFWPCFQFPLTVGAGTKNLTISHRVTLPHTDPPRKSACHYLALGSQKQGGGGGRKKDRPCRQCYFSFFLCALISKHGKGKGRMTMFIALFFQVCGHSAARPGIQFPFPYVSKTRR